MKRLLKSQVIIARLHQYANKLHTQKKDFQEAGDHSESDEDDFNEGEALLSELLDLDEEEQEEIEVEELQERTSFFCYVGVRIRQMHHVVAK